ncbi:MAG: sulfatase-like hydrolase/transferase [Alphaproteobacteria bacterium]|nr:sulfatase-like hydrolase/transferase [Alphaproteobacteria bacterium]
MGVLTLLSACTAPAPPSVLVVTLDTTRADHIGAYGYRPATTPTLDRLAAEGTRFARAYSACPLTIPSHATIFTGVYPPSHGVRDNGDFVLGPEAVTLAERFAAAGWTTAAFTSAFPTQARWGLEQGFATYHDPLERLPTQLDWRDERRADEVVDDALATLADAEGPLFVWVHLFDAHWPYDPPPPYDVEHEGRPYDGEIAFADAQLGRLLAAWDAARPRSLVVVTADHGEGLGDGGERTHGFLLHDGTIRVPLILRGEGVAAGQVVEDPVGHVDIAPTVLAIAGLPPAEGLQGQDLRTGGSEALYAEALTGQFNLGLAPLHAITEPAGRYTEGRWGAWYSAHGDRVSWLAETGRPLDAEAARLAALRASLEEVSAPAAALDPAALQQLQALGYIGGDVTAEAGDIDPRDVIDLIPLTWMARQAIGEGHLPEAQATIARLEERMPETWGVALLRAQLLQRQGRFDEAAEAFADLYLRSPSSTVALQLAGLAARQGAWAEALGWYQDALALQPASPEAMAGEVRCLQAEGHRAAAQERAARYLAIYPDHAQLAVMQAEMLLADQRVEEALEQAQWALRRMPGNAWAWSVVAEALWAQGRADPAIEHLTEALRLDPFDLPVRVRLTRCLLEVGRSAEAARTIAPAARLWPEDEAIAALKAEADAALAAAR